MVHFLLRSVNDLVQWWEYLRHYYIIYYNAKNRFSLVPSHSDSAGKKSILCTRIYLTYILQIGAIYWAKAEPALFSVRLVSDKHGKYVNLVSILAEDISRIYFTFAHQILSSQSRWYCGIPEELQ